MSGSLKGLASIAKGLSAAAPPELVAELTPISEPASRPIPVRQSEPGRTAPHKETRPLAKTRNAEYKRVMVLVKKATEKKAYRKWEDANPEKDFSDLVETLLSGYAAGSISV